MTAELPRCRALQADKHTIERDRLGT